MTTFESQPTASSQLISPATRLGHVHLTVADLERQLAFYQNVLGLRLHWREGAKAGLGAGKEDLLRLTEVRGARRMRRTTGLYHFALEYPSRRDLALVLARLFNLRYPNYPTDLVVSKATYLDDPEGQNIELYALSPEDGIYRERNGVLEVRHADGRRTSGPEALDVEALLRELQPGDQLDAPIAEGTRMGHVQLYVASLAGSMHFYRDVLGFQEIKLIPRIGEVTLNGYLPHVIAFNTSQGEGAPPPPANSLGMRYFEIVLPDQEELFRVIERVTQAGVATEPADNGTLVRDPSHIGIILTTLAGV